MPKPNNPPALPRPLSHDVISASWDQTSHRWDKPQWSDPQDGMTLRDYFAAKAMQSICQGSLKTPSIGVDLIAQGAYELADAMIAERAKNAG